MEKDILRSRIIEQRKKRAWSQVEFAKRMNAGCSTVAMWETGDRVPDTPTVHRLAEIFGVSADYLLGLSDNPSPNKDSKLNLFFHDGLEGYDELTPEEQETFREHMREEAKRAIEFAKRLKKK